MAAKITILGIAGSLRKGSFNRMMANTLATVAPTPPLVDSGPGLP